MSFSAVLSPNSPPIFFHPRLLQTPPPLPLTLQTLLEHPPAIIPPTFLSPASPHTPTFLTRFPHFAAPITPFKPLIENPPMTGPNVLYFFIPSTSGTPTHTSSRVPCLPLRVHPGASLRGETTVLALECLVLCQLSTLDPAAACTEFTLHESLPFRPGVSSK